MHLLRQRFTPAAAKNRILATLEGRSNLEMVALDVCLCARVHAACVHLCVYIPQTHSNMHANDMFEHFSLNQLSQLEIRYHNTKSLCQWYASLI